MLLENLSPSPVELSQPSQPMGTLEPIQIIDPLPHLNQPMTLLNDNPNTFHPQTTQSPTDDKFPPVVTCLMLTFNILSWVTLPICGIIGAVFPFGLAFFGGIHLMFYILTIVLTCVTSPIWKYLNNKSTNDAIIETVKSHFTKAPVITLTTKSYHIVSSGNDKQRRNTHEENVDFKYYSWKDVSGTFHLDLPNTNKKPMYLLLRVKNDINFADSITVDDYMRIKKDLYARNANKDENIEETEERTYEGYKEYTLVKLGEDDSCFFNKCVLVFMLMCSLGVVFCWKFEKRIVKQAFVVKKLVSTRYNLLEGENYMKYSQVKPMVAVNSNVYECDEQVTGCVIDANKMAPPSAEELEKAKMYEKEVPQY